MKNERGEVSVYDQIGGEPAVAAAVGEFYQRVLHDPTLASKFDGVNLARLKMHQAEFLTAALGGPNAYAGRELARAHMGLDITIEDFERVIDHFSATLMHLGVDLETVSTIVTRLLQFESAIVTPAAPS